MRGRNSQKSGYGVAVLATAAMALLRYSLSGPLGDTAPFIFFVLAVVVSAWYGGFRPGLLATLLSAASATYLFIPPDFSWRMGVEELVAMIAFLIVGVSICALIEQLHQARERLRTKRELLRRAGDFHTSIAELTTDFAFSARVQPNGNVVLEAVTEGFSGLLGYTLEETNARGGWRTLIYPEDMPRAEQTLVRLLHGEVVDGEIRTVARNGDILWMRYRKRPVLDERGVVTRIDGALQNINREKHAEQLLRHSERALQSELRNLSRLHELSARLWRENELEPLLHEVLKASIELLRADKGNIRLYDEKAKSLNIVAQIGFDESAVRDFNAVPMTFSVLARAVERAERIIVEDIFAEPEMAELAPVFALHGFVAVQSTPLMGSDGRLFGILSTHFKEKHRPSEGELRLLDLYARQAEWVIERKRAEESLREADRRKDDFIAQLAHELRNPLAPLRHSLSLLELAEEDKEIAAKARATMERQLAQMVRLVDDLLDMSRIDRDKLELRKARVELSAVISNAVEAARPLVESARHKLSVSIPPEDIHLDADAVRLAQAFSNLLNNACKFTQPGGHISITAERQGDTVVVSVSDTGVGIPSDLVPRIFDKFMQADGTLERSHSGLGIGLALVKRLVEMHGGEVGARSEGHGRGSEFTVRLPVMVAPESLQHPSPDADTVSMASFGKLRVLVVDDNRDSADSLAGVLRIMGNEVRTAYDGLEAVEVTSQFWPNAVLLDIGLPRLNGYDTARRIREMPSGEQAVIVAVTGLGQEEDRRRSEAAGIDHHVVKPVDPLLLEKVIGSLVVERQSQ